MITSPSSQNGKSEFNQIKKFGERGFRDLKETAPTDIEHRPEAKSLNITKGA
jgi:hypothetical protein